MIVILGSLMMRVMVPLPSDGSCNRSRRIPECSTLSTSSSMTITWAPGSADMGGGQTARVSMTSIFWGEDDWLRINCGIVDDDERRNHGRVI